MGQIESYCVASIYPSVRLPNMRLIIIICAFITLTGCVKHMIGENFAGSISAIPKSAKFSGWILNHCNDAKPIKLKDLNCAQHGGEIYSANISFPRDSEHRLLAEPSQILIVQHALLIERTNQTKWCFDLKLAPSNLSEATGVKYIAMSYKRNCDTSKPNKALKKDADNKGSAS